MFKESERVDYIYFIKTWVYKVGETMKQNLLMLPHENFQSMRCYALNRKTFRNLLFSSTDVVYLVNFYKIETKII